MSFRELYIENDCLGKVKQFTDDYSQYFYLNKVEAQPHYRAYDDTKFDVYMMSALPGTGKDTFIRNNFTLPVLSLDDIRHEHGVKPGDTRNNGHVIQMAKEKARELLRAKQPFVFNGTNLTKALRGNWISLFMEYGAKVHILYLEIPYRQLLIQNRNREHAVPEKIIDGLIQKLEVPDYSEAHSVRYVCAGVDN